jgi:hypothetical protein
LRPVWSAAAEAPCPPKTELASQMGQRVSQLRDTRDRLKVFVAGQDLNDVPPAALFNVDLLDEEAVQRRVKELTPVEDQSESGVTDEMAKLAQCAKGDAQLQELAGELKMLGGEINNLRLAFLSLPRERREALVNAQKALQRHSEKAVQLAAEHSAAEQQQQRASKSIEVAQELAKIASSADLRELASQRALLESAREELARMKVRLTTGLQERTRSYQETAEALSAVAGVLAGQDKAQQVWDAYNKAAAIWRDLVDKIFERVADPQRYEPLPQLPALPQELLARVAADVQAVQYQQSYQAAQQQYRALSQLRAQRFDEERDSLYRLLLQAGRLRSELLRESVAQGDLRPLQLSDEYLGDVAREIRIEPYQALAIFYSKVLEFRQKANAGLAGWIEIANQVVLFAVVVAIPFLAFYALRRFTEHLNRIRRELVRVQAQRRNARALAIWIRRLTPYVPWGVMLLGVWVIGRMLERTAFAEMGAVLPYVAYYLWYRVFLNLLSSAVGLVAYSDTLKAAASQSGRIQHTAKRIVLFFVVALAFLHATEDVVGRALVYRLVFDFMRYAGAFVCFAAARQWRVEIAAAAGQVLPHAVAERLRRYCSGTLSWIVCLPTLMLVIAAMAIAHFQAWAGEYDFFKRMGAELFRRRIASVAGRDKHTAGVREKAPGVPQDYLDWFDLDAPTDPTLLVEPSNGIVEEIESTVDAWLHEEAGEHSLALYGDKGSGKSSLLRVMERDSGLCRIQRIVVPPKLCTREAVLQFFGAQLGVDLSNGLEPLLQADVEFKKTLVLVDEAHNLFLAKLGGFDGYRAFMELVNGPTSNLFWCVAFNRRSWRYLSGVLGGAESFRKAIDVPPLGDEDVERLIMTRHRRTSYRLAYDAIIRATQSEDDSGAVEQVEAQFFRLLWGQSRGNPRAAIVLWTGALTAQRNGRLKVGVPQFQPVKSLERLGDDAWFVYSAILRHENLAADEAAVVTNLPLSVVRDALRIGIESRAIARGANDRYRVTPAAQFYLTQLLLGKNFIHE